MKTGRALYKRMQVARGARASDMKGAVRVNIALDEETFGEVRDGAVAAGCSFAAQARLLIALGLEAAEGRG
jgi:hypothetical protein